MRSICFIIFLFTLINCGFGQSFKWASSAGGKLDDEGKSICVDAKGNYFVAGEFESGEIGFGKYILTNKSSKDNSDMFLVKYDPTGKVLWAVSAGGNNDERPYAICTDPNGNCYVTGYTESPGMSFGSEQLNRTDTTSLMPNMFIVKYDAAGEVVMKVLGEGTFVNIGNAICADANENIYVTGRCSPVLKIGDYTLKSTFGGILIAKLNSIGKVLWAKAVGGPDENEGNAICVDAQGNCFVTGMFTSRVVTFGTIKLKNYTSNTGDLFVVKYDSSGKLLWANSSGGLNDDPGNGIGVDSEGNCIVVGTFLSNKFAIGNDTLDREEYHDDAFIAKYDASGKVLWARSVKGSGDEEGKGICIYPNGDFIITGYYHSQQVTFGTVVLKKADQWSSIDDMFIAKYDGSGKALWAVDAGGKGNKRANSICMDANENIIVAGYFDTPTLDVGSFKLTNVESKTETKDVLVTKLK